MDLVRWSLGPWSSRLRKRQPESAEPSGDVVQQEDAAGKLVGASSQPPAHECLPASTNHSTEIILLPTPATCTEGLGPLSAVGAAGWGSAATSVVGSGVVGLGDGPDSALFSGLTDVRPDGAMPSRCVVASGMVPPDKIVCEPGGSTALPIAAPSRPGGRGVHSAATRRASVGVLRPAGGLHGDLASSMPRPKRFSFVKAWLQSSSLRSDTAPSICSTGCSTGQQSGSEFSSRAAAAAAMLPPPPCIPMLLPEQPRPGVDEGASPTLGAAAAFLLPGPLGLGPSADKGHQLGSGGPCKTPLQGSVHCLPQPQLLLPAQQEQCPVTQHADDTQRRQQQQGMTPGEHPALHVEQQEQQHLLHVVQEQQEQQHLQLRAQQWQASVHAPSSAPDQQGLDQQLSLPDEAAMRQPTLTTAAPQARQPPVHCISALSLPPQRQASPPAAVSSSREGGESRQEVSTQQASEQQPLPSTSAASTTPRQDFWRDRAGNLRLQGAAALNERTKTIAVASHCPEDIFTQYWSVEDFTLLKKLYEGNLSVVCQAQHRRTGRHFGLKIYKRSRLHEMERFQLAREICLHIRILHPYIISLYAAWKDSKYVYLLMEWAPRGNLFDFLVSRGGRLPEQEAAQLVVKPLLASLAFLHSQQFIHRDIKLENIVMDGCCNMKLADFGLAIDQKFEQANTRLGTFGYFAPEVLDCPLKKSPFDYKDQGLPGYDNKVDVWSGGVVVYELLTGRAPFSASSAPKIIEAIRSRELSYPEDLSSDARSFLTAALTRDPSQRPTAKQLLAHPWIARTCGVPRHVTPAVRPAHTPDAAAAAAAAQSVLSPQGQEVAAQRQQEA